jgi:hydrogenase maturation factor
LSDADGLLSERGSRVILVELDGQQGMRCETDHGSDHCITCGDEAVPLRVLRVDDERGLALCEGASGEHTTIETALIPPVVPGDGLLAHAGTAIAPLPRSEVPYEVR